MTEQNTAILRCEKVRVTYGRGRAKDTPLDDVSLTLDTVPTAVMGPSGSGKSTLLRVLAGLQRPAHGSVEIDGEAVSATRDNDTTDQRVSFIHQDHRLVDFLTVEENLRLAAELRRVEIDGSAFEAALATVGLEGYGKRWPATLSGGEQQRVGIARALLLRSRVVLADEPTGALDADNSLKVADLLVEVANREGMALLIATHDPVVAERIPRVITLSRGRLIESVS